MVPAPAAPTSNLRQDGPVAGTTPAVQVRLTFQRAPVAGLDALLPARTKPFLGVVLGVGALLWVAGWLLAGDRARFLVSREWWVQPFYLAAHLALLRLFASAYARSFLAGCVALEIEKAEVERRLRRALGPVALVGACVVAAPLIVMDVGWLSGAEYLGAGEALGPGAVLGAADWLMAVVWGVEWVVNAYVWMVIVDSLVESLHVLRRHPFRDPVERVLRLRQYRPFLLMNAQGATLTLAFGLANVAYVWIAKGTTSDYVGLWVTGALVLVGFVPPWMTLKARLGTVVEAEAAHLGDSYETSLAALPTLEPGRPASLGDVAARVDHLVAMARLAHLQRLHEDLGKGEAQAVILRLLVPAFTAAGRLVRPFLGF